MMGQLETRRVGSYVMLRSTDTGKSIGVNANEIDLVYRDGSRCMFVHCGGESHGIELGDVDIAAIWLEMIGDMMREAAEKEQADLLGLSGGSSYEG